MPFLFLSAFVFTWMSFLPCHFLSVESWILNLTEAREVTSSSHVVLGLFLASWMIWCCAVGGHFCRVATPVLCSLSICRKRPWPWFVPVRKLWEWFVILSRGPIHLYLICSLFYLHHGLLLQLFQVFWLTSLCHTGSLKVISWLNGSGGNQAWVWSVEMNLQVWLATVNSWFQVKYVILHKG